MTDVITYGMGSGPLSDLTMSLPPSGGADIYEPLPPEPGLADLVEDTTLVRDVMHEGVIVCDMATPLLDVARTMLENQIHAVVVVADDQRAAGVVSQTDVVLAQQGRSVEQAAKLTASDVMTPSLVSCTPDRKLERLGAIADLGALVEDVDVLPPSLEDLYAHFSAGAAR